MPIQFRLAWRMRRALRRFGTLSMLARFAKQAIAGIDNDLIEAPAAPSTRPAAKITTEALTAKFGAQPQTPRASYCRHGHWMGLVPTKMPNGRLLWDEAEADALLSGHPVKADPEKIDSTLHAKPPTHRSAPHTSFARPKRRPRATAGEVAA